MKSRCRSELLTGEELLNVSLNNWAWFKLPILFYTLELKAPGRKENNLRCRLQLFYKHSLQSTHLRATLVYIRSIYQRACGAFRYYKRSVFLTGFVPQQCQYSLRSPLKHCILWYPDFHCRYTGKAVLLHIGRVQHCKLLVLCRT